MYQQKSTKRGEKNNFPICFNGSGKGTSGILSMAVDGYAVPWNRRKLANVSVVLA